MAQKRKIGIPFFGSKDWIAGAYYITNLIHSLKLLPEDEMPEISAFVFSEKEANTLRNIHYPFLKTISLIPEYNFTERVINKISRMLTGRNKIEKKIIISPAEADVIFPFHAHAAFGLIPRKLYWIPDFQEHYYPEFFTTQEIELRKKYNDDIAASTSKIVFSSIAAQNDFAKFYPNNNCKTYVLNFAVTHPDYNHLEYVPLKKKFGITAPFFFVSNQFWKHKNHEVVLKAVNELKGENLNFQIVFTGKEKDHRNPDYFTSLRAYVEKNNIGDYIRFLGFIDRREQLKLMNEAIAVVQPSLFEGWSTVVEDSKAINQFVILSDLPAHREQMDYNCEFFKPRDEKQLSKVMKKYLHNLPKKDKKEYSQNVKKFAQNFVKIVGD